MFITNTVEILAFNKTGDAVLIELSSHGPEGGGSRSYTVLGPKDSVSAEVSSDFSPGDGSTPETVSGGDCRSRVKKLGEALLARGFDGVTVHPNECGADSRGGVVQVGTGSRAMGADAGVFGDVTVTDSPGGVTIKNAAGELSVGGPEHGHVTVWRQANGPLLIVQYTTLSVDSPATIYLNVSGAPAEARFPTARGTVPGL